MFTVLYLSQIPSSLHISCLNVSFFVHHHFWCAWCCVLLYPGHGHSLSTVWTCQWGSDHPSVALLNEDSLSFTMLNEESYFQSCELNDVEMVSGWRETYTFIDFETRTLSAHKFTMMNMTIQMSRHVYIISMNGIQCYLYISDMSRVFGVASQRQRLIYTVYSHLLARSCKMLSPSTLCDSVAPYIQALYGNS